MAVDAFIAFQPANQAMAPINGESLDLTFKNFFAVKDFSFGVENKATVGSATGGAGGGKVQFNEFQIKKVTDNCSPSFFKNACAGAHYKLVTLAIRKAGADAQGTGDPYLVYNFGTVFATKIDWNGPGDEGPEESITFAYGCLSIAYWPQKADGTMGSMQQTMWNQMTNKATFGDGSPKTTFP